MARKLITAQDVDAWPGGGPLVVDADVLVTPAAVDRAAELGLPIVYRREPPRAAVLPEQEAGDDAWYLRIPRQPGAEYHVRVTETGCDLRRTV